MLCRLATRGRAVHTAPLPYDPVAAFLRNPRVRTRDRKALDAAAAKRAPAVRVRVAARTPPLLESDGARLRRCYDKAVAAAATGCWRAATEGCTQLLDALRDMSLAEHATRRGRGEEQEGTPREVAVGGVGTPALTHGPKSERRFKHVAEELSRHPRLLLDVAEKLMPAVADAYFLIPYTGFARDGGRGGNGSEVSHCAVPLLFGSAFDLLSATSLATRMLVVAPQTASSRWVKIDTHGASSVSGEQDSSGGQPRRTTHAPVEGLHPLAVASATACCVGYCRLWTSKKNREYIIRMVTLVAEAGAPGRLDPKTERAAFWGTFAGNVLASMQTAAAGRVAVINQAAREWHPRAAFAEETGWAGVRARQSIGKERVQYVTEFIYHTGFANGMEVLEHAAEHAGFSGRERVERLLQAAGDRVALRIHGLLTGLLGDAGTWHGFARLQALIRASSKGREAAGTALAVTSPAEVLEFLSATAYLHMPPCGGVFATGAPHPVQYAHPLHFTQTLADLPMDGAETTMAWERWHRRGHVIAGVYAAVLAGKIDRTDPTVVRVLLRVAFGTPEKTVQGRSEDIGKVRHFLLFKAKPWRLTKPLLADMKAILRHLSAFPLADVTAPASVARQFLTWVTVDSAFQRCDCEDARLSIFVELVAVNWIDAWQRGTDRDVLKAFVEAVQEARVGGDILAGLKGFAGDAPGWWVVRLSEGVAALLTAPISGEALGLATDADGVASPATRVVAAWWERAVETGYLRLWTVEGVPRERVWQRGGFLMDTLCAGVLRNAFDDVVASWQYVLHHLGCKSGDHDVRMLHTSRRKNAIRLHRVWNSGGRGDGGGGVETHIHMAQLAALSVKVLHVVCASVDAAWGGDHRERVVHGVEVVLGVMVRRCRAHELLPVDLLAALIPMAALYAPSVEATLSGTAAAGTCDVLVLCAAELRERQALQALPVNCAVDVLELVVACTRARRRQYKRQQLPEDPDTPVFTLRQKAQRLSRQECLDLARLMVAGLAHADRFDGRPLRDALVHVFELCKPVFRMASGLPQAYGESVLQGFSDAVMLFSEALFHRRHAWVWGALGVAYDFPMRAAALLLWADWPTPRVRPMLSLALPRCSAYHAQLLADHLFSPDAIADAPADGEALTYLLHTAQVPYFTPQLEHDHSPDAAHYAQDGLLRIADAAAATPPSVLFDPPPAPPPARGRERAEPLSAAAALQDFL